MATQAKPTKPKTNPDLSYGLFKIIETEDGDLRLVVDIHAADKTPEALLDRLRATLCGMQYVLNKNEEEVLHLGEAYIEGLETGLRAARGSEKISPEEAVAKMGFHANL